jgi:hypothetical protein
LTLPTILAVDRPALIRYKTHAKRPPRWGRSYFYGVGYGGISGTETGTAGYENLASIWKTYRNMLTVL